MNQCSACDEPAVCTIHLAFERGAEIVLHSCERGHPLAALLLCLVRRHGDVVVDVEGEAPERVGVMRGGPIRPEAGLGALALRVCEGEPCWNRANYMCRSSALAMVLHGCDRRVDPDCMDIEGNDGDSNGGEGGSPPAPTSSRHGQGQRRHSRLPCPSGEQERSV